MTYYIHAAKFFLKNRTEFGGYLEVTDEGKFGFYYPENEKPNGKIKEYPGKAVAPGYVDTHIHGLLNEDVMKSNWQGINKISEGLLAAGVTSWLPTTITASNDTLTNICKMFAEHRGQERELKFKDFILKAHSLHLNMVELKILNIWLIQILSFSMVGVRLVIIC